MKNAVQTNQTESPSVNAGKKNEPFFQSLENNFQPFFGPTTIQPKLKIGQPDDPYEKQADRVADAVTHMPDASESVQRQEMEEEDELRMKREPILQRKCKECEQLQTKRKIQTKSAESFGNASAIPLLKTAEAESKYKQSEPGVMTSVQEATSEHMIMGDWKAWVGNGEVVNNYSRDVTVWSSDDGTYTIPAHSRSESWGEDVDHVRDIHGQWWKIGWNTAVVDSNGEVSGAKCRSPGRGQDCGQLGDYPAPGGGDTIHAKLKVNQPNDRFEQEADAVAEKVVNGEASIQRKCAGCEEEEKLQRQSEEEKEILQGKSLAQLKTSSPDGGKRTSSRVEQQINSSRGSGQPLPRHTRSLMENGIGAGFRSVKVHTDDNAVQMNRELGARAFTNGNDIYFNSGEYRPETSQGRHLLAHELTHVVQQGAGSGLIQTDLDDKHNLTAALFSGEKKLEDAFDGEDIVRLPDKGPAVKKLQQALIQLGFSLPSGDDSIFGGETQRAVKQFQTASGLTGKDIDGIVGKKTMGLLDVAVRHGATEKDTDAASEDFKVKGKFKEKPGKKKDKNPAKIYFDLASAELDSEEEKKIVEIAAKHKTDPLTLIGYASEEGSTAFNRQLAGQRIDAVDDKLLPIHNELRILENRSDVGEGKIDYRNFRSVEILTPGEKSAHQSCDGKSKDKACPVPNTTLNSAVDEALRIIKKVKDEQLPPKKTKESDFTETFSKLFRNNDQRPLQDTVTDVQNIFDKVAEHLKNLKKDKKLQRCGSECDGGCAAGSPAYNTDINGKLAAGRLTMCDGFFDSSAEKQAIIIIHEGHHGTPRIPSSDKAYQHTRLIDKLDHKLALQNAASFHLYAQLVNKPGSASIGPKNKDAVTITDSKQREKLNLSLAFIEQWFTLNTFDASTLHAGMDQARKQGGWKDENAEILMEFYFAPQFGFTKPPAIPTEKEQASVAAIFDRLTTMEDAFDQQLVIEESTNQDKWERGPGQKIEVTANILTLDQQRQVIALVQELVRATPDISATLAPEYVILINELRKGRSLDP